MALRVFTARLGYRGADRLDVTRKGADPVGVIYAPSWAILRPALDALRLAGDLRRGAGAPPPMGPEVDAARFAEGADVARRIGEAFEASTWALYRAAYLAEMRESYRRHGPAWRELLARESVTLMCFCADPARCHRTVLGAEILPALGAAFDGEREKPTIIP